MRRLRGTLIALLIVATAAGWLALNGLPGGGGAGAGGGGAGGRGVPGSQPVPVEVAPVESGLLRDTRILSGTLEASSQFVVAAKIGGRVEQLLVDLGDPVERDQVIAELDDDEYVQAAAQAEAELAVRQAARDQAASTLELAQREHERAQALRERGIASESQLDEIAVTLKRSRAALALVDAQVAQAGAALELTRIRLGYTTVRAAWSGPQRAGLVSERFQDPGNTVQPGDAIVSVVVLDPLNAVVSVTERDYALLSVGQEASLRADAHAGREFPARIARIAPVFRESSRQARLELDVANPEGLLKPGMFVRVSIVMRRDQADAIVPLAAISRRDGLDVVFVLDEEGGRVRRVPVRVGIVEGERAAVAGEGVRGRVVVLGQQLLDDGSPVAIHGGLPAGAGAGSAP